MKVEMTKTVAPPALSPALVNDYAYHLYEQSGFAPGHDLENWLEAEACIRANVDKGNTHTRLHRQRQNSQEVQSLADYRI